MADREFQTSQIGHSEWGLYEVDYCGEQRERIQNQTTRVESGEEETQSAGLQG